MGELKGDIGNYPGKTNDEKVKNMLIDAKKKGFEIIPFSQAGVKQYTLVKNANTDKEDAYNPMLEGDWIKGFPKGT